MGDIRTHYAMHLQGALYKFCTAYHATKDIFVQPKSTALGGLFGSNVDNLTMVTILVN